MKLMNYFKGWTHHPDMSFTVEVNQFKFVDTKIHRDNNEIKYFAYQKEMKLQFYWTSAVPKHCKKNVIIRVTSR